jgi:hypothetical protein
MAKGPVEICGHERKLVTGGVRVCTKPKGHFPSYEHNEGVLKDAPHPYQQFVPTKDEGAEKRPTTAEEWAEWQRRRTVREEG